MMYTFDTETSYNGDEAWIWSWALCDEDLKTIHGNGTDVLSWLCLIPDKSDVYVHNLSYDAEYLHWDLQRAGWALKYDLDQRAHYHGVYTMLEDTQGVVNMTVYYKGRSITLRDSNRIFRCALAKLPKLCGFEAEEVKGSMDYVAIRPRDHIKTPDELAYQLSDVRVLMRAMKWLRAQSPRGYTIGSIAMHEFKEVLGKSPFGRMSDEERHDIRSLYNGGIVHIGPSVKGVTFVGTGRTYDENSMYPHKQHSFPLPVSVERHGLGNAPLLRRSGTDYAVHVQAVGLRLRKGGFPLLITPFTGRARSEIAILDKWLFIDEYEALLREYDIEHAEVIEHIIFNTEIIGREFVDKWYTIKSTEPHRRTFAKFVLNNVTGKLAEHNVHEQIRRKVEAGGDYVNYRYDEISEPNRWTFMPATAKITSLSRLDLRQAVIDSGRDNLLYCDTDSVHTTGTLPPHKIDENRLGAWKCEVERFDSALYIKPKSYWEGCDGKVISMKHAGINPTATLSVGGCDSGIPISPDNMAPGAKYWTNQSKRVKGGVAIVRIEKQM